TFEADAKRSRSLAGTIEAMALEIASASGHVPLTVTATDGSPGGGCAPSGSGNACAGPPVINNVVPTASVASASARGVIVPARGEGRGTSPGRWRSARSRTGQAAGVRRSRRQSPALVALLRLKRAGRQT